jgi:hypothetical protein
MGVEGKGVDGTQGVCRGGLGHTRGLKAVDCSGRPRWPLTCSFAAADCVVSLCLPFQR